MKSISNFLSTYKLEILLLSALIVIVGFLEYKILYPHILYGFGDVDWVFLYRYKNLPPFSLNQIVSEWQASGVYAYQTYYIGLQSIFFGVDYWKFQLTTNIFKFLSTITLFPLLLYITKNRLLAFIATIIYGVTYPSIGAIYTVVTSGIYFAIFVINIFLLIYAYVISNKQSSNWWLLPTAILYYLALFFSTERLYPLIPLLVVAEVFILWKRKFPGGEIKRALARMAIILAPLLAAMIYRPYAQNNAQFLNNTWLLVEKIVNGNWHLLMVPFSVLGSLFIPRDYWRYFGSVDVANFERYQNFYLFSPFLVFAMITLILAFSSSKRPLIFIAFTLIPTYILGTVSYFLTTHHLHIPENLRMHYDPNIYLPSALFGQFILSLSLSFLVESVLDKFQNRTTIAMFFSILMSFFFIFSTWLPAEPGLIFSNVHRYLTIPAIGSSIFIAGALLLVFNKMSRYRLLRPLAFFVFLLLFPIIVINAQVLNNYFKDELDFTGMRGSEHLRMKSKLVSYLPDDFNTNEPTLFFIEPTNDQQNGYFHETTILAGFEYWMLFRNHPDPDKGITPFLVRTDFLCPKEDCIKKISAMVTEQNGKKGLIYKNVLDQKKDMFYPENNVYFYKLANRDVLFTQDDFKQRVGLK